MTGPLFKHLDFLYGEATAHRVLPRVQELIERYRPPLAGAQNASGILPLTERDILLITYGDQVREAGVRPLHTLADFLTAHLRDLVSRVHILPFYPSSSDDGFSVVDYYSVDPALGTWDDIAQLGRAFGLMFDAVVNHISASSAWFQRFLQDDPEYRDWFIVVQGDPDLTAVVRPRALPLLTTFQTRAGPKQVWTTFSADQIDLNYHNPELLLRILEVLLFYTAHGARWIRLDAVAFLWKGPGTSCLHLPQTHALVQLMRAVLDQVAPDVLLITETNVPHRDNVSYWGDGNDEAQLVYNFALPPLVLDAIYRGSAGALTRWARSLAPPSRRVSFLNFLASHDGIGLGPARGILSEAQIEALVAHTLERGGFVSFKNNPDGSRSPYELNINYLDAVSGAKGTQESPDIQIDRFMSAQAIMLSLAGVPGIYFHSLFGSRGDRAGAESSGIPRRINRQKPARDELERELADRGSLRARVFARYARLLEVRRAHPAFHPLAGQQVLDCGETVFGVLRTAADAGERILCLHNVGDKETAVRLAGYEHEQWKDLVQDRAGAVTSGTLSIEMRPYQTVWLRSAAGTSEAGK